MVFMESPKRPPSRGIKSKESLQFDYDKLPMSLNARWEPEDILKIIFPPQLQKVQYEIATKLLRFLSEKREARGREIEEWAAGNSISNSTLRNLVIPKLVRVGLLARERRNPTGQGEKDKRHEMVLVLSKRFGEAFQHIGREWNAIVETWRVKSREQT